MVRSRLVPATALLLVLLALVTGPAAAQAPGCEPGSGPDFAGRRPTVDELPLGIDLRCADFTGADLSGFDFTQEDLTGALLVEADLTGARLSQATLDGADLTGATLDRAELTQADLVGAVLRDLDLSGRRLVQVDLTDAEAAGIDLSGADLTQATLDGADLTGANLSDADLGQANLVGADLSDADLSGADLTQAELGRADLTGANLAGATLTQADVDGAITAGIRGVRPYADWLLYGAIGLFVLLMLPAVRRALRPRTGTLFEVNLATVPLTPPASAFTAPPPFGTTAPPPPTPGAGWPHLDVASAGWAAPAPQPAPPASPVASIADPVTRPDRRSWRLFCAIVGSAIVALGLHLLVGGGLGLFGDMLNPLAFDCDGPQCMLGTDAGALGLTAGVFVLLVGLGLRSNAS